MMRPHLLRRFNEPTNIMMPGTMAPLYAQDCVELMTLEKVKSYCVELIEFYLSYLFL